MPLSLKETEAISKIAEHLYSYLPGKPHPYADQSISFLGAATAVGLGGLWPGGSKLPAVTRLLETTLDHYRTKFCNLILEIVRHGIVYRKNKGVSITREEIKQLNDLILGVQFKIPDLWDPTFLDTLPRQIPEEEIEKASSLDQKILNELKSHLVALGEMPPQKRGYAFERFLQELFSAFGLAPRQSFRITGEQIDGSFDLDSETYLVEAKWQNEPIGQDLLLVFSGKVSGKAIWSRGLFISYGEFSKDGLEAFSKKGATSVVGMTGQDLWFILEGSLTLSDAIRLKVRRAAETGDFYVPVFIISRST